MAQDDVESSKIKSLKGQAGKTHQEFAEDHTKTLPHEILLDIFSRLNVEDLTNLRLVSSSLLPVANTLLLSTVRSKRSDYIPVAKLVYNILLPEGRKLPEYSDVNRKPYQGPPTFLTIKAAASLMKIIPEKQPHLVQSVVSIQNDRVRAESLSAVSDHYKLFDEPNLTPIIDAAWILSKTPYEGEISGNPTIPANRALKRSAAYCTPAQTQAIEERKRSDWRFRKSMEPNITDDWPIHNVANLDKPILKIPEISDHAIARLGGDVIGRDYYRTEELLKIAINISTIVESLDEFLDLRTKNLHDKKAPQTSSARDFSGRVSRESQGRGS